MRFDPFRELDRLAQQSAGNGRLPVMAMDAYRHGESFVVHFDLPGVDPASIDLTVEKNVLTVSAERRWQPTEGDEVVVAERAKPRKVSISSGNGKATSIETGSSSAA